MQARRDQSAAAKKEPELGLKRIFASALQVGLSTALAAALSLWGGLWLDRRYHTGPLFTLVGVIVGLAASLSIVWKIVKPFQTAAKGAPLFRSISKTSQSTEEKPKT